MLVFQNYIKTIAVADYWGMSLLVEAIDANESKDVLGYHVEVLIMFDWILFLFLFTIFYFFYFSYNVCSYEPIYVHVYMARMRYLIV